MSPIEKAAIAGVRAILSTEDEDRYVIAAEFIIRNLTKNKPESLALNQDAAIEYILQYVAFLLDEGEYLGAAHLLWGEEIVSVKPKSVQMIWEEMPRQGEMLIMGAGSMGKSYSVAVWLLLDWLRDPQWTCIKVLSVTKEHAQRNVFAHIQNLHERALVPLPGDRKATSIIVGNDQKQGIHLMTISEGDSGEGKLRGFHPVPRGTEHPKFGNLSRVRAILDEAEEIPHGVWQGVDNMLITKHGVDQVKIIAASNPKDRNSKFGMRCEPEEGWGSVSVETSEKWRSKLGWMVLRLDGATCENVIQRKIVFPGLLTWQGYERYLALGDTSASYFTMCRGWFPEQGLHIAVIPLDFVDKAKGTFIFSGRVTYCASADLAFEGGDQAVMTIGRFGRVTGWTPPNKPTVMFEKPKYGIQIEQQFGLNKGTNPDITEHMTKQIMESCKNLRITHDWLIVDRTGNGTGVYHMLLTKMGQNVMGLHWGEEATEKIILEDEPERACDVYKGVVTELFFATRKYIEFDYLKFSPALKMNDLSRELTGRYFSQVAQKKARVESKKEYKARGFASPDHADSATMLVHLIRMRSEFAAAMLAVAPDYEPQIPKVGTVDRLDFITFQ